MKTPIAFLLLLVAAVSSCKKNSPKPDSKTSNHVYVAGSAGAASDVVYWEDNSLKNLTTNYANGVGEAIAVNGKDVYVAGYRYSNLNTNSVQVATYWKNGFAHTLTDTISPSWAIAIAISGSDVYVAGVVTQSNGMRRAAVWKNEVEMPLQFGANVVSSEATGLAVSNSDVYVVGNGATPEFYGIAAYWKNGVETDLNDPYNSLARATAITVNGQDVYVAGDVGSQSAAYWKNGTLTALSADGISSFATGIQVQNGDVYIAGEAYPVVNGQTANFVYSMVYWKNGSVVNTDWRNHSSSVMNVGSMKVIDTNVYVAGSIGVNPVYWNNGRVTKLSSGAGTAMGITVANN